MKTSEIKKIVKLINKWSSKNNLDQLEYTFEEKNVYEKCAGELRALMDKLLGDQ